MNNAALDIVPRYCLMSDATRLSMQPPLERGLCWPDNFLRRSVSKRIGSVFESHALRYLSRRGLKLVARNVRYRRGEIDLVMQAADGTIVFVEVRARHRADYGGALASIDVRKRFRLIAAARVFLAARLDSGRTRALPPCRFDIVAFDRGKLRWIVDAFSEEPGLR